MTVDGSSKYVSSPVVRAGSRVVGINTDPVPATGFWRQMRLEKLSSCRLLLREKPWSRVKGVLQCFGFLYLLVPCVWIAPDEESSLLWWVLYSLLTLFPLSLFILFMAFSVCDFFSPSARYLFNQEELRLVFNHHSREQETRSLSDILAVQSLLTETGVDDTGQPYSHYQLNLVFERERMCFLGGWDLETVLIPGQTIADFLGVPLFNQVTSHDTDAPIKCG